MRTAREILGRGDCVLIFPEGTRMRPGSLGTPQARGRPAGARDRRPGRPRRRHRDRGACARAGASARTRSASASDAPLRFPVVEPPSPQLAGAVTERIWPCVMLQWEWLGGLPPLRRAAIVGAGSWGISLAVVLARAGLEVELGCRTAEQAEELAPRRENARYLPGVALPDGVRVDAAPPTCDSPRTTSSASRCPRRALPAALAAHGPAVPGARRRARPLQGPRAAARHAAQRVRRRARAARGPSACLGGPGARRRRARSTAPRSSSPRSTRAFAGQLADVLPPAGWTSRRAPT